MLSTTTLFACGGDSWGLLTPVFAVMAAPLCLIGCATFLCHWLNAVGQGIEIKNTRRQIDCGKRGVCYRCDATLLKSASSCLHCGAPRRTESCLLPKVQLRR